MKVFVLAVLLLVVTTHAKKKGDMKSVVGYKECGNFKESYKKEGKQNKAMKWIKPKAISDICGVEGECPVKEELENSNCGFGIRSIASGKWVSTEILQGDGESRYDNAFLRLFSYISGSGNQAGTYIPMTSPVLMRSFLDGQGEEESAYMHFYLPSDFQENPPAPTSDLVEVWELADTEVYYRAFGFKGKDVPEKMWEREFRRLGEAISKAGLNFDWREPITATFTQPGLPEQRHEVMFEAKEYSSYEKYSTYDSSEYSWEQARGYVECAQFPDTVKPKAIEGICGHDAQCPEVEEMENEHCGFGIRNIKAGKWASTDILDSDGDSKYVDAFMRLFDYIRGENEDIQAIDMTIPVITKTYLDENFEERGSTMHYYLPAEYHDNPPTPINKQVEIEEWIDTVTYYRTVGEYDQNTDVKALWDKEFKDLAGVLSEAGENFWPYMAVTATFTRPGYGDQRHEAIFVRRDW